MCLPLLICFPEPANSSAQLDIQNNSTSADVQNQDLPWIGIAAINITEEIANTLNLTKEQGILITDVIPGSNAERKGLQGGNELAYIDGVKVKVGGDIILKADYRNITNTDDLHNVLNQKEIGDILELTVLSDSQTKQIGVIVDSKSGTTSTNSYGYRDVTTSLPFENTDLGIRLSYPSNWNLTEYEDQITISANDGSVIDIFTYPQDKNDTISELVNQTLGEYVSAYTNFSLLNLTFNNGNLLQQQQPQQPSATLSYSFMDYNGSIVNNTEVIAIHNNKAYSILFSAYESEFEKHVHEVNEMLRSLKIFSSSVYENLDKGVRMQYPSDWAVEEGDEGSTTVAAFLSPGESSSDEFSEQLVLESLDLPQDGMNLSEAAEYSLNRSSGFTDFRLLNTTLGAVVAGKPAFSMVFSYYDPNSKTTLFGMVVGTIENGKLHVMTYYTQPSKFFDYLQTAQRMIDSFRAVELLPYENLDKGVRMQYPSDWINTTDPSSETSIFRVSANETDSGFYVGTVYLEVLDLPQGNKTVGDYLDYRIKSYNETQEGFNVIDKGVGNETLGGHPAYTLDYNNADNTVKEIGAIIKGKVYVILYVGKTEKFADYLPTAQRMIDSFDVFTLELYDNSENKILIKYPSAWHIEKSSNGVKFNPSGNLFPRDNLTVYSFNSTDSESLDSIVKAMNNNYTNNLGYEHIGNRTYNIITTLDNDSKATQSFYRKSISNDFNISMSEILTKYENKIYSIKFQTMENRYDKISLPSNIIDVIKSFRIIEFRDYGDSYKNIYSKGVSLTYPSKWILKQSSTTLSLESQEPRIKLSLFSEPVNTVSLYDTVSNYINSNYKVNTNYTDFKILDSYQTTLLNDTAHKIAYSFTDKSGESYKELAIFSKIGIKYYTIVYSTVAGEFTSSLPTIERILNSTDIAKAGYNMNKTDIPKTGIPVGGAPVDIAINSITNKMYIAIPELRSIQVMDGTTEKVVDNITIGAYPNAVAVDSINNRVYVTSPESDMLYIIDGLTNNITHKLKAGTVLGDIAIDNNEFEGNRALVFVASTGNNSISVVDGTNGKIINNIKTNNYPQSISIDPIKNRAFVTTGTDSVVVIDYRTDLFERTFKYTTPLPVIKVGLSPFGIVVDPTSSRAYVANSGTDNVSIIDTNYNYVVGNITVGLFPSSLAFDEERKTLYIATGEGNVSIVDTNVNDTPDNLQNEIKVYNSLKVDSIPYDVAINPVTNTIYLANYETNTISLINGITKNRTTATTFNVFPPNAAKIVCDNVNQNLSTYIKLAVNTKCDLFAEQGFAFDRTYNDFAKTNSNYTLGHRTLSHLYQIFENIIANAFGQTESTKEEIPIDHYGTYTYHLISFPSIISSASIYLSFGTLLIVIVIAILKSVHDRPRKSNKKHIVPRYYPHPEDDENADIQNGNVFSKSEIIGFDVAVIAGILIFLTISEGFETGEQLQISMITATIVFPFAISAVFAITEKIGFSTRLMAAGFINLMIAVLLLAIMKVFQ